MKKRIFKWENAVPKILIVVIVYLCYLFVPLTRQPVKIGATYMTMNNTFYTVINDEIRKRTDANGDVLKTLDPALSIKKQCQQIETFIREDFDVIVINPVSGNSKMLNSALKKARACGIKIIAVDSQLKETKNVDCTIVSDNYNAGVLCAKDMMKNMSEAKIVLLKNWNALSVKDRYQGFSDTIKGKSNYRIVEQVETLGQTEIAMPKMKETIRKGIDFNVVMALDDQSAIGSLAAVDSQKVRKKVRVYGIDGSANMKKLLSSKDNAWATVAQSPIKLGEKTANIGYRLASGKNVPKKIIVPVHLITKENIDKYSIEGWQ